MPDSNHNVRGLPVPEPEAYVTREELAVMMRVGVRTIDRFRSQGMPCESWGMRAVRFQPSRAIAWARARPRGTRGNQEAA